MRQYIKVRIPRLKEIKVQCNKCETILFQPGFPDWIPTIEIYHEFGYFSPKGWDETKVTFDLCESCLVKFIKTLKIKAEITSYNIGI